MIRVIIADDESILREGIKFIIESDPEIKVVGFASNGEEAYGMCKAIMPDLILMDVRMPGTDGITATKYIKESFNDIKVMILTTHNDENNVSLALENGADAYILKDLKSEELILSIKSCIKGLKIIHEDTMTNIVKNVSQNRKVNFIENTDIDIKLTSREKELLTNIVKGRDNKEISKYMYISEGSVRNLISRVLKKLNLRDRMQLAVFAAKNDIM